jgi:hypothetical protein|eukprot:COSAG06_NODE_436_length_15778_cov_40.864741_6_plen_158_part_00
MALSHSVKQWGLLSWNKRWMTFEGGTISLYKSEHGPEGDPIVAFDLSAPGCKYEVDPVNACRLSLDNSIALIHIKFDDAPTRAVRLIVRASPGTVADAALPLAHGNPPTSPPTSTVRDLDVGVAPHAPSLVARSACAGLRRRVRIHRLGPRRRCCPV